MEPEAAKQRRQRHRAEARRSILDATEALLIEHGLEAFSIRRLAHRSGYSAPTIYHHFRDKDGLIDALLQERFQGLIAAVKHADDSEDPADSLRRVALAFLEFALTNPTFYRLSDSTYRDGDDRSVPAAEEARQLLWRPLQQLWDEGRLPVANLDAAKQVMYALLHGLAALQITRTRMDWAPGLNELALDVLLRGLIGQDETHGN